ncbi:MAG TPA: DUF2255 family protein [Candidatus Dormibacteraeota bacterium]|nr:DUF2255 family protein [Candidatus Dormibacteraeota bacterium]
MARLPQDRLWKIAESDEVQIETRRDAKSPAHRTTIWIVPAKDGIYVRSVNGKRARWWQEATANPQVTIHVGREKVDAHVELEKNPSVFKEVSEAYREKYNERWPGDTDSMVRHDVLDTTLRLSEIR